MGILATMLLVAGCQEQGYFGLIDLRSSAIADIETANLSAPEDWGRWTDGSPAIIKLGKALPHRFIMDIMVAHSFGANVNQLVLVRVGGQQRDFRLPGNEALVSLNFSDVAPGARLIVIDIPRPTSPKSLGTSADIRELGIGLASIRIKAAMPGGWMVSKQ